MTDHSRVVPNPRISAGSTVGSTGPTSGADPGVFKRANKERAPIYEGVSAQHLGTLDNRSHINVRAERNVDTKRSFILSRMCSTPSHSACRLASVFGSLTIGGSSPYQWQT